MRTIILLIVYVVLVLVAGLPILFFSFLTHRPEPLLALGKFAMRISPAVLGLRLKVFGRESIDPHKNYVFMANHLSFLDGPLLFLVIPQPVRVILKREIFRIPFVGIGMKMVDFVPVDRRGVQGGKKAIQKAAQLMKERGYSFLIFPEGTRSRTGEMQAFRRGGFFLALESGAPIVPITVKGTFELMPRGSFFCRPGQIEVIFHPPVSTKGYTPENMPELIELVRKKILTGLEHK
ncbi:MAG: 1-acyl-sn-glycerol-3-phosphate acyltransferase [Candidatus Aminicenantes bacterium]|nr:1-acyl-sn-glycerol-3-phosphate acyltransferase [Candidatus Aminicenantes bacterium]